MDYTCSYLCSDSDNNLTLVKAHYTDLELPKKNGFPRANGSEFICDGLLYEGGTSYNRINGVYNEYFSYSIVDKPVYPFDVNSSRSTALTRWGKDNGCEDHFEKADYIKLKSSNYSKSTKEMHEKVKNLKNQIQEIELSK